MSLGGSTPSDNSAQFYFHMNIIKPESHSIYMTPLALLHFSSFCQTDTVQGEALLIPTPNCPRKWILPLQKTMGPCCSMAIASCSLETITDIYTADTAIFFRWFYNTVQCTSVPDGLPGPTLHSASRRSPPNHSCTNTDSDPLVILPSRPISAHISHAVLSVGKPFSFF